MLSFFICENAPKIILKYSHGFHWLLKRMWILVAGEVGNIWETLGEGNHN